MDEDCDPSNPSIQNACEASPARCGDEYSFVAASANDLDSSVYRISKQNAEAAHKIAEAEHKQLVASLWRAASSNYRGRVHYSNTQDLGRARQARALQAPRRAAREEPGARAAQEQQGSAQGREDLPRRPGLRQRRGPGGRGAPRGDPRGPVPPTAQGGLVRRLPGYVIIFLLLGVVQAPSTPTAGLLRVRQRSIDVVIPARQKQPRVRVHRGRELLGIQRQEERVRE